jgi:hypothetical protein
MHKLAPAPLRFAAVLLLTLAPLPSALRAQSLVGSAPALAAVTPGDPTPLPDDPLPADPSAPQTSAPSAVHTEPQTRRILGIIPNFRAVSADQKLPPQTVHDKLVTAAQDSFDYSSIFLPSVVALYNYKRDATPEFGKGGVGYGRYLWHSAADQTVENLMVEFAVPSLAREDTRYYTLGRGGFLKRAGYSLSRVAVTRSDRDTRVVNLGEIVGAGAAAGISNLYYPRRQRGLGNTADQWGLNVGIDAATFAFKEFWPDSNHARFHSGSSRSSAQ